MGELTDDQPMIAAYGQYWRVAPDGAWKNILTDFNLYPDTYYDLSDYVSGPVEVSKSVALTTGDVPLTACSVRLLNDADRFNRRNASSPYIEGTVNHLRYARRVTVEWIGYGSDWQAGVSGGALDWRLLCSFAARQWNIERDEFSYAVVVGETLNRLSLSVDVPLLEVKSAQEILEDWVLEEPLREQLQEVAGDLTKYRLAVFAPEAHDRTSTSFQETVGRGTFGNAQAIFTDPAEEDPRVLYAGYFGVATDGTFLYTCHSMELWEGAQQRGMYVVKRSLAGASMGDIYSFYESDTSDIEAGDVLILGGYMWLHTGQQAVTNNVFKIDVSDWTVTASYSKKGGAGHYPVHAATDGTNLYVLYDGGSEGRVLYKIDPSDHSTTWSHTFVSADNDRIDYGVSGMVIIGSATLVVFTRSDADAQYYAVRYTLSDTPAYATWQETIPFETLLFPDQESVNNQYGWASVVKTNAGLLALTGPAIPTRISPAYTGTPLWVARSGGLSRIGRVKYYLQNGKIINKTDAYTHPDAEKGAANYALEEVWVDEEVQDNTGTYVGHVKTTDNYDINLLTGEIIFLTPPRYGSKIKANYDYKPSVQYFQADQVGRWAVARQLSEAASAIVYPTAHDRVSYRQRRAQEDTIFGAGGGETYELTGRNVIHPANTAYTFNTLQVANAEHNYFYVEGTHYTVSYSTIFGTYTITEVGTSLAGHVVITYLQGPSDDALIILDDDAVVRPPSILGSSEQWDFSEVRNQIVVQGRRRFPTDTPTTIIETYAVSPRRLNIDSRFSKVQRATPTSQYDWDGEQKLFVTDEDRDVSGGGFILSFSEPMIIGTTKWLLREPDTTHVEGISKTQAGGAAFVKVDWAVSFTEPGSVEETTGYDVIVSNKEYWRVCTASDESAAGWPGGEDYKSGSHVYVKKFRDGGAPSDDCIVYAFKTKDTSFYIDRTGTIREAEITDAANPSPSASPDKSVYIRIDPIDDRGGRLFREPGTYDSVIIPASLCLRIGAVRVGYDGVALDVYNHSSDENYVRITVIGYPIASLENIIVKCEDRIHHDGSLSSVEKLGLRPRGISNDYVQSVGLARTLDLLDWQKEEHSLVPATCKFTDELDLLDACLIQSTYGHFASASELWLVVAVTYSVQAGDAGASVVTLEVIDVPESPSAPAPASS
jgi:hypothetical protein